MKTFKSLVTGATTLALCLSALACSDDEEGGNDEGSGGGVASGGGTASGGNDSENGSGGDDGSGGDEGDGSGGESDDDGSGGGVGSGGDDGAGSGGDGTGGDTGDCSSLLETAAATPELSSLVAAVEAAGLAPALESDDLTVFAPDNDAFADLLTALGIEFSDLTAEQLVPILTYHVVDGVVPASTALEVAAADENTVQSLGGTIRLSVDGDSLVLDEAEASARVTAADIPTCNGVVHLIDKVLLPSISDIVVSQESFSGLETLIGASATDTVDVAAALDGPSPSEDSEAWTLFAPDNDAVQALLDLELGLSGEQITDALLYHAYSEGGVDAATAMTLDATLQMAVQGEELAILGDEEEMTVTLIDALGQEAMVTIADIYTSNGIIHVIDTVLVPPSIADTL